MKGIVAALEQIGELAKTLLATPEDERILIYRKLDPLFLQLEGRLSRTPAARAAANLAELRFHLIHIARLDDPDGATDAEHYREALEMLAALRRFDWPGRNPNP